VKLSVVHAFPVPREKVYAALNDPAILRRCIEGCEELVATGPDTFSAKLKVGVAAVKGSYAGTVRLTDRKPPESLTLTIEGKGLPGFVRSTASIRLAEKDGGTELAADGEATVGGLIAAVGSRLVEGLAKKMIGEFFQKLGAELARP
jgi:carbon monoxide dehydrogenase subunit G